MPFRGARLPNRGIAGRKGRTHMRGKILVVDDEEAIRHLLYMLLTEDGFEVNVAADRFTFKRKIREFRPDCIILDLMLGADDGTEVYEDLIFKHELNPKTPVIFLTGLASGETPSPPGPGRHYVLMGKPFSHLELIKDLDILIENHRRETA